MEGTTAHTNKCCFEEVPFEGPPPLGEGEAGEGGKGCQRTVTVPKLGERGGGGAAPNLPSCLDNCT